jgi:hypothetical protein
MKVSKMFFFEKKNQKTFRPLGQWCFQHLAPSAGGIDGSNANSPFHRNRKPHDHVLISKSFFAAFFSKKEVLPSFFHSP